MPALMLETRRHPLALKRHLTPGTCWLCRQGQLEAPPGCDFSLVLIGRRWEGRGEHKIRLQSPAVPELTPLWTLGWGRVDAHSGLIMSLNQITRCGGGDGHPERRASLLLMNSLSYFP